MYTIAEFEKLFDEYYETVDPEKWQKKVDAAQAKLDKLLGQRYDACTEHVYGEGVKKRPHVQRQVEQYTHALNVATKR